MQRVVHHKEAEISQLKNELMHMSTLTSSTMSVLPPPPQAMTQTVNASSAGDIREEPTATASGTNVAAGATRSNRGREKVSFTK